MNLIQEKQKLAGSLKQITIDAETKILELINTAQQKLEQRQNQAVNTTKTVSSS